MRKNPIPVIVSNAVDPDPKAGFPDGTRVITADLMMKLLDSIERFVQAFNTQLPLFRRQPSIILDLQAQHSLTPEQFKKTFTVLLGK